MLYPELFKQLEAVRWDMDKDIPWKDFDPKIQFLAASARVRPEFMLAYATAALGGISGIRSSIQGLVG
ncbi:MAG: hypothetical protein R3317_11315, partial [Burkholderiaceae bacterium]|nr:hypothetical protein [Burkholderiaceae bacterium]